MTVVSQATAEIVRDRLAPGLQLVDVGHHELRGLSRPERVFELRHGSDEPAPQPGRVRLALPRSLQSRSGAAFVGRTVELARLLELWSYTSGGNRAVFVAGEPGIAGGGSRPLHGRIEPWLP